MIRVRRVLPHAQGDGELLLHPDRGIDHVRRAHGSAGAQSKAPIGIEVREGSLVIGAPSEAGDTKRDSELRLDWSAV